MSTIARHTGTMSEVLGWFESEPPFGGRGIGLTPFGRIEDVVEHGEYVMRAQMPGIDPAKDIEVRIEGDFLIVRAERREERRQRPHHEFRYGWFERSVRLPKGTKTEALEATYVDGVLELRVPLDGEPAQAVTVPVQRPGA